MLTLKKYRYQKGLSLIEVVLAIAIIGMIGLIIASIPNSFLLNSKSRHQSTAAQILSEQIENLRLAGFESLSNGNQPLFDSRLSQIPFSSGQIEVSDCPIEICTNQEEAKFVKITISWKDGGKPQTAQIDTIISQGGLK